MSTVTFDIVEHADYLEFVTSGDPSESQWIELLQRIVEELQRSGKARVFVDASGLTTLPDSMVRYRMGIRTGESLSVRARVAVLHPTTIDDNFWETVATNRGALARSGENRAELIAWLLQGDGCA
ncbi:hypothetical protein DTL21_18335 [Bremerella cremea]|uniref:STAS/SEC14 domain-containing protein n=1 Tax=Blastopirellula marina TaxID=124 RepID=A0A2S8FJ60_9BACT|nr:MULTISPECIES: hypothetical protein [Pirellulaceae]PQO32191.1 hypothetical protein C5Y83_18320 [Blastopirellula marina]RCS45257.1 hypothetical protein DTL21_18335 [Bremerella cremea]